MAMTRALAHAARELVRIAVDRRRRDRGCRPRPAARSRAPARPARRERRCARGSAPRSASRWCRPGSAPSSGPGRSSRSRRRARRASAAAAEPDAARGPCRGSSRSITALGSLISPHDAQQRHASCPSPIRRRRRAISPAVDGEGDAVDGVHAARARCGRRRVRSRTSSRGRRPRQAIGGTPRVEHGIERCRRGRWRRRRRTRRT